MKIQFHLSKNETSEDITNFTIANAIYRECVELPQLSLKVIAEMILLQYAQDNKKHEVEE